MEARLAELDAELADLDRVVVAFSGGADSAFLAARAGRVLGDRALAVTAVSPSLAGRERTECEQLATEWGLRWVAVETFEMERVAYRANDADRCFHCKSELMDALVPLAATSGATIVLGVNLDDLGDHRPGQRAAAAAGASFPLVTARFTKDDVRAASRSMGLRTWDKPANACLASRIPYGTEVSVTVLSRVERAEAVLHRMGFPQCRVRHYGDTAHVEVELDRVDEATRLHDVIAADLVALGYREVIIDPDGFRSGKLNDALRLVAGSTPHGRSRGVVE